jgi:predicted transcriptional regulator of viral defense system
MVIARLIKEKLSSTPAGVVLTTRDFGVEMRYQPALAKALNRLVLQGELQKIAKGKYYIPKKTIFGNLKPADSELVKDFLEQNGKIVGYITGTAAFAAMGLTTQISSSILVGTNKYRRPITRNGVKISFLLQENTITSNNIPLLRILDALRLIKDIPATSPDECVTNICKAINALSMEQKRELAELSLAYTPYVRALLGAIYENMELETETISKTLNGVTSYKLPISDKVLSNKRIWNII